MFCEVGLLRVFSRPTAANLYQKHEHECSWGAGCRPWPVGHHRRWWRRNLSTSSCQKSSHGWGRHVWCREVPCNDCLCSRWSLRPPPKADRRPGRQEVPKSAAAITESDEVCGYCSSASSRSPAASEPSTIWCSLDSAEGWLHRSSDATNCNGIRSCSLPTSLS